MRNGVSVDSTPPSRRPRANDLIEGSKEVAEADGHRREYRRKHIDGDARLAALQTANVRAMDAREVPEAFLRGDPGL